MIIIIVLDRNSLGNKKDYHSFKKQQQLRGGGCFLSEQISIIKLCLWDHGQLKWYLLPSLHHYKSLPTLCAK